jgi:hypothetical protein
LIEQAALASPEDLPAIAKAVEVLGDKGGYLSVDKLVHAEVERTKSIRELLESPALNQEQKDKILAEAVSREKEVLGELEPVEPMKATG